MNTWGRRAGGGRRTRQEQGARLRQADRAAHLAPLRALVESCQQLVDGGSVHLHQGLAWVVGW